ncbi:MAG TPA: GNAT family protein [Anaerolineae bacterium]|nr:GNAT family protein [Anaerolineae bacterium]
MKLLETDRLVIREIGEADVETILPVYLNSADYMDTQTPDEPSSEMVREDLQLAAQHGSLTCGIFRRDTGQPIGLISFVPQSFRGQRDYAWLSQLMIQENDRLEGYGREAYQAVEDLIFSDPEVKRIGTLLIPQFDASLRFAEKLGFEQAGGPFKNKRGYGLYSFVKKRPGQETPGEKIWHATQPALRP